MLAYDSCQVLLTKEVPFYMLSATTMRKSTIIRYNFLMNVGPINLEFPNDIIQKQKYLVY